MDPPISTPPCPGTVTLRRNPPRRARPTPATSAMKPHLSPHHHNQISHFPIQDILSINLNPQQNPNKTDNLRVFLRIKPIILKKVVKVREDRNNVWPKRAVEKPRMKRDKAEICLLVNDDGKSVTLCPPKGLHESKRARSEVFEGFENVFSAKSSQVEVFDKMVKPLVDEFLRGKSGTLVALGPSGSGKTHTVFGSPREPGMVPLAVNQIFSENGMNHNQSSRTFYLSMFEISERGKAERLCDLLQDGGDLSFQQSVIRGLQEVLISDIQQAECLIARGMLKRATAMTNSNSQSSRSQCVINIRTVENKIDEEADRQLNGAVLTIVDLAGAEREKKTGNQGTRLLESNFINTTSMVFGLCLRSLLEHQKNPKRPLQKHFQSSLLTRYLREYLEGKKRMALILTVKSGEEDYVDSSLLLRQASPYTKIKFDNAEEVINLVSTKRHKQTMPRIEPSKRMKFSPGKRVNNGGKGVGDQLHEEEGQKTKEIAPQLPVDHAERMLTLEPGERVYLEESSTGSAQQERSYMIMQKFAKALWTVLKEYKRNLEVAENKIEKLTESLADEKARSSAIEKELMDLKGPLSYVRETSLAKEDIFSADRSTGQVGYQRQNYQVVEGKIHNLPEILADEQDRSSEIEIELEDLKGSVSYGKFPATENDISADRCAKQVEYHEKSCKVAENQNLMEILADEKASNFELEIELEDLKGPVSYGKSPAKEDNTSADRSAEEVEYHEESCQVAENQNVTGILADEKARGSKLEIQMEDLKGFVSYGKSPAKVDNISADRSAEQVEYHVERCQVSKNPNVTEILADEKARSFEIEIELEYLKGSVSYVKSPAKEENISTNRPVEQVEYHEESCQVVETQNLTKILSDEKAKSSELEKELDLKGSVSYGKYPAKKDKVREQPLAITKNDRCHSSESNQIRCKEYKEQQIKDQDCDIKSRSKIKKKSRTCKASNVEKPKRRLAPASSILLKDLGGPIFDDENEKPKGTKGDKKGAPIERNITQGSLSLLRLLNSNLHS